MDKLKKGDRILVRALVECGYSLDYDNRWKVYAEPESCRFTRKRTLYRHELEAIQSYVFIGWTYRHIGCYYPSSGSSYDYEPPSIEVTKRIRVAVIVPIEDDARYFTPVLCLLEDISE